MKEALKMALEALETPRPFDDYPPLWRAYKKTINEAITAIEEALAQPEFAIGDIRALRHRIHELEGEVIGYKQILDAQPEQEPVDFDAIIADIEAISCRYQVDPSHDHCPYKIRSESADTVRRHASYYTTPPQRKPLLPKSPCEMTQAEGKMFKLGWLECEAAHGIKE